MISVCILDMVWTFVEDWGAGVWDFGSSTQGLGTFCVLGYPYHLNFLAAYIALLFS